MKDFKFALILLLSLTMFAFQLNAKKNYKKLIYLQKEWKRQTRAPHEIPLEVYLIGNQQLEIQSTDISPLKINIKNDEGNIVLTNMVYLNNFQPVIVDLNSLTNGTYILYLYNDYIEAEGTFYLDN